MANTSSIEIDVTTTFTAHCRLCRQGFSSVNKDDALAQAHACEQQGVSAKVRHSFDEEDWVIADLGWGYGDGDTVKISARVLAQRYAFKTHHLQYLVVDRAGKEYLIPAHNVTRPGVIMMNDEIEE